MPAIHYHKYKNCPHCKAVVSREDEDFCRKCGKYIRPKEIKTMMRWTMQQDHQ